METIHRHETHFLSCLSKIDEHLGNSLLELRSQTTRLASTFHALMHPSAVPIRSFHQDQQYKHLHLDPVR